MLLGEALRLSRRDELTHFETLEFVRSHVLGVGPQERLVSTGFLPVLEISNE